MNLNRRQPFCSGILDMTQVAECIVSLEARVPRVGLICTLSDGISVGRTSLAFEALSFARKFAHRTFSLQAIV